ncbi:MAG: 4Fe-4S dicluster domain-containing protein [Robiginitalea sp.]|jgi:molybdopterin-containing oxidoreductase family iron-sulfur binding subunit
MEESKNKRREFVDKGLKAALLGAVATGALKAFNSCTDQKPEEGEETVQLMTTDGDVIEVPASQVMEVPSLKDDDYNVREGYPNRKFVMVVDLARCKNAKQCISSCNKSHFITGENAWLKVYKMQESKDTAPYWQPTMCMHCDKPACVKVCPVDATFKRRDGIVLIDNERCIGCRFCMAACPYSTRVFNWEDPKQGESTEIELMLDHTHYSPDYAGLPSKKGTVDKCDFCPHMIDKKELPHCVTACPNGVFFFGDAYEDTVTNGDETFRLKKLLEERAGYRLFDNLGTEPSVFYLPPRDRLVDFQEGLENYDPYKSVGFEEEAGE